MLFLFACFEDEASGAGVVVVTFEHKRFEGARMLKT